MMLKRLFFLPVLLMALPSCDSAQGNPQANNTPQAKVSTAVIQILPTTPVLADPALRTENFIANEIASLSMGMVLKLAAAENEWENLTELEKGLKVERLEGTDLARLTATGNGKVTGREFLDGLIQAYMDVRNSHETLMEGNLLKALDDELIAQSDLVQDCRKELTVLTQQYGIPYFQDQENMLGVAQLASLDEARRTLLDLQLQEKLLKAKLSVLDDSSEELKPLTNEVQTVSRQAEAIAVMVDRLQDQAIDVSLKQNQYQQSIEAYEQAQGLLRQMKQKQMEARVSLKMPRVPLIVRQKPD